MNIRKENERLREQNADLKKFNELLEINLVDHIKETRQHGTSFYLVLSRVDAMIASVSSKYL